MRHLLPVLLIACGQAEPTVVDVLAPDGAPSAAGIDGDGFAIPRGGLVTLASTPLTPGGPYTMTVTGAAPGELVHIARSTRGLGAGPCLGTLGGLCLDVRPPVALHASGYADGDGVVVLDLELPLFVPAGADVFFQAVIPRGDTGFAWLKSDVLETMTEDASLTVPEMVVGDLVVTEVMVDPTAPGGEWFEVYNNTDEEMNLNGLRVVGAGDFVVDRTLYLAPRGYAVFAYSDDPGVNGGLPAVDWEWGDRFSLSDVWGEIALMGAAGILDVVAWDDGAAWPIESGSAMGLKVDPDPDDNDLGDNWCVEGTEYGDGDSGTPGAGNACNSCRTVDGIQWCHHPSECGLACEATCAALGLSVMADSGAWLAAQDTVDECQAISDAFDVFEPVVLSSYTYACMEDSYADHDGATPVGPFLCSTSAGCPDEHRTNMDQIGVPCGPESRLSICPCE